MKAARTGLIAIGFLPVVGRFLGGAHTWGFHHTAYLPAALTISVAAGALLILLPAARRALDGFVLRTLPGLLFGRSPWPGVILAALLAVAFYLLRTPTHFLGDGVLVGELVGLGSQFRAHDLMDYYLHLVIFEALFDIGQIKQSFDLYAAGSCIAGLAAVATAALLLRRSRLPAEVRTWIFLLWLIAAPILIFCGYVESYGYLSVAMLGFLWSGALAQRGEVPPWLPGLFYGFALFFHTTALFAAPALLWLILRPGTEAGRGRRVAWALQILIPAVVLPLIAAGIHLAAGYDMTWFRRDFLESKNQRHVLVKLGGAHGFLSIDHWRDLLNWILLAVPVTTLLIATRIRTLRARFAEPDIAFLTVQTAAFLIPFLFLDRKIGAARDWDLFTPQVAGFSFLAVRLWQDALPRTASRIDASARAPKKAETVTAGGTGTSIPVIAVWVSLLLVIPWLGVNASREASLDRFDDLRAGFARFPKAYATEELAKYYRDNDQLVRSRDLYEESVRINPRNARTRILLGSVYYMLRDFPRAEAQYDTALVIDSKYWMALDMKGKMALERGDMPLALEMYRRKTEVNPKNEEAWAGYGYALLMEKHHAEAEDAFRRAKRLHPGTQYDHYLGLALAYQRKWDESIASFRSALGQSEDAPTLALIAAVLESRHAARAAAGQPADPEDLREALVLSDKARRLAPNEPRYAAHVAHLERVLAGREAAREAMTEGIGP